MKKQGTKIVVVGAGQVGATTAYTLLLSGLASELVLIDLNEKKARGEVLDLAHGIPLCPPAEIKVCLLYTSPSPRDLSTSRMPSSA